MSSDLLAALPLTFVMIAGPQIISAVFFATSERWAPNTLAYIGGAAISITAFVTASYLVGKGAKDASSDEKSVNQVIYVVILVLLLAAMVRTYVKRGESEPPKWMGRLQTARPKFAFLLGMALLGIFPTDILTSVAVGQHLAAHGDPWGYTLIFVGLTLFLLAIPGLLVVLLGHRAKVMLPKVRDWMNTNSWIVSELVLALFVVITANSLASA
jgi:Sap, sulfolipid-1-addressing protein